MGVANLLGPGLFTEVFALFIAGSIFYLPGAPFLLAAALVAAGAGVAWRTTAAVA